MPELDLEQLAIITELSRLDPSFDRTHPIYIISHAYLEEIGEDEYSVLRIKGVKEEVIVPSSEVIRRRLNEGSNKFCGVVGYHTQDKKLKFELVKFECPEERKS